MKKLLLLMIGTLAATTPSAAQTLMPEPFGNREVSIEILRPLIEDADDLDLLSFSSYIYTRLPINDRLHFVADLPWARIGGGGDSSTGLGNVMLGLEAQRGRATWYGNVRLPTASDDEFANIFAVLAELPRLEVWVPDLTTLSFGAMLRDRRANGHGFDFQLGTNILKPDEGDWEMLLDYGAQYVYRPAQWGFTGGIQGKAAITGEGDFDSRTFHDARLRVDYTTGRFRPAIGFTVPFDEGARDVIDGVLRLGLQVGI